MMPDEEMDPVPVPVERSSTEPTFDEPQMDDEVEMIPVEAGGVDEKSSSFPFGAVAEQHSETSDDIKETRGEDTLLASLAGDNANSLPSVGGNDESDTKKSQGFDYTDETGHPNAEKLNSSEDSSSHHAIAESLGDEADTSNATIVNTEIISEDELPPPSKPEINDAEEVSDEELPAPQRAELPADAEVISEDELPTHNNNNNSSDPKVPLKRKADKEAKNVSEDDKKSSSLANSKDKSLEQYNPSSPTSESNDAQPLEKRAKVDGKFTEYQRIETELPIALNFHRERSQGEKERTGTR